MVGERDCHRRILLHQQDGEALLAQRLERGVYQPGRSTGCSAARSSSLWHSNIGASGSVRGEPSTREATDASSHDSGSCAGGSAT